jgi:hypothetical protein
MSTGKVCAKCGNQTSLFLFGGYICPPCYVAFQGLWEGWETDTVAVWTQATNKAAVSNKDVAVDQQMCLNLTT